MKTRMFGGLKGALAVASATIFAGCIDSHKISAQNNTANPVEEPIYAAGAPLVPAEPAAVPPKPAVSAPIAELGKLAEASLGEDVMIAYINKQPDSFNPSADEILYLNDLGVSDRVITALVNYKPASAVAAAAPTPPVTQFNPVEQAPPPVVTAPLTPSAEVVPAEPAEVNNYFYTSLSPYGSWIEVEGYGACWRPTVVVVNPSWRPYCDRGHWVYTDAGWYWQSDYSWGWAPFHYGRWMPHNRHGWVWMPDRVWGPSWVSWRYSNDYCGWAPLPPAARFDAGFGFRYHGSGVGISFDFGLSDSHYTFIPTARFCDRYPARYAVDRSRARTIYHNTTVINNYIRGNNNTVINEGVGRERIAAATRTEVRKVALRDTSAPRNPARRETFARESNTLPVFRPHIAPPPAASVARREPTRNDGSVTTAPNNRNPRNTTPAQTPNRRQENVASRTEERTPAFPAVGHTRPTAPAVSPQAQGRPVTSPEARRETVARPDNSGAAGTPAAQNRAGQEPARPPRLAQGENVPGGQVIGRPARPGADRTEAETRSPVTRPNAAETQRPNNNPARPTTPLVTPQVPNARPTADRGQAVHTSSAPLSNPSVSQPNVHPAPVVRPEPVRPNVVQPSVSSTPPIRSEPLTPRAYSAQQYQSVAPRPSTPVNPPAPTYSPPPVHTAPAAPAHAPQSAPAQQQQQQQRSQSSGQERGDRSSRDQNRR